MGQKAGTRQDQFYAYVASLGDAEHKNLVQYFADMDDACSKWKTTYGDKPTECDGLDIGDGFVIPYSELRKL